MTVSSCAFESFGGFTSRLAAYNAVRTINTVDLHDREGTMHGLNVANRKRDRDANVSVIC